MKKLIAKKYIQLTKKERKGKTAAEIMELREKKYLAQFTPGFLQRR